MKDITLNDWNMALAYSMQYQNSNCTLMGLAEMNMSRPEFESNGYISNMAEELADYAGDHHTDMVYTDTLWYPYKETALDVMWDILTYIREKCHVINCTSKMDRPSSTGEHIGFGYDAGDHYVWITGERNQKTFLLADHCQR